MCSIVSIKLLSLNTSQTTVIKLGQNGAVEKWEEKTGSTPSVKAHLTKVKIPNSLTVCEASWTYRKNSFQL